MFCRWSAQPSAPRCVRSSLLRQASWWTAQWRRASRPAARPATTASCWSKSPLRPAWWARPSMTCCNTSATTPAAASRSDATTRPQTPSWTWRKTFLLQWATLVSARAGSCHHLQCRRSAFYSSFRTRWCLINTGCHFTLSHLFRVFWGALRYWLHSCPSSAI